MLRFVQKRFSHFQPIVGKFAAADANTTMSNLSLNHVRAELDINARKTKMVCTLGPSCWSVEGLTTLIDSGMNIARFNFSHGDHAGHFATLQRLREAVANRPGKVVAVMLDTKGPEIRTGSVEGGGKVHYTKGDIIEVGTDYTKPCTSKHLAVSYKSLPTSVKVGGKMLCADGSLTLKVLEIKETSVLAEVLNNATFGDHKNMNLPGAIVDLPTLTERDVHDLVDFGVANEVDFIAASFVRTAGDIDNIRTVLGEKGKFIKIIAKIENLQGLENFDAILEKTDGIMVARGDLGMEIPIEKVFIAQKMMIHKANLMGKPVVTATQMLESMITNPRPTRAECADVANAVLDGSDCVMLSGETAGGEYPFEAAKMMASICVQAESLIDFDAQYDNVRHQMLTSGVPVPPGESIASSAVKTARDINANLIVVLSETGTTARLIAKYRPAVPILAVTNHKKVARQVAGFLKGTLPLVIKEKETTEQLILDTFESAVAQGMVNKGDTVVVVHGSKGALAGSTSSLRVCTV